MRSLIILFLGTILLVSCTSNIRYHSGVTNGYVESVESVGLSSTANVGESFTGVSSYYADKFHGRKTANGEIFNMYKMTCAHKTLPFGTKLKVTNISNDLSVIVTVNDRGPYAHGRVLDLSKAAAEKIDLIKSGTAKVKCEIIK